MLRALWHYRATAIPAILVFLLTLVPAGFGHTIFGLRACYLVIVTVGLSLIFIGCAAVLGSTKLHESTVAHALERSVVKLVRHSPACWFLGACAGFMLAGSLMIGWEHYSWLPIVPDSVLQYAHGRLLSQGRITAPGHGASEFFYLGFNFTYDMGRWFTQFPPGHIAMLALGHLAHAPWLVNPLLGAFTVAAIYAVAREAYEEKVARLSALLAALCPQILFMSSEYMNHATTLLMTMLCMLATLRALRRRSWSDGLMGGAALGMIYLTRPLTAVCVGVCCAGYALWQVRGSLRGYGAPLLMALGMLFIAADIQIFWNLATTHLPLTSAYRFINADGALVGFGRIPNGLVVTRNEWHTPAVGVGQMFNNLNGLQFFLFRWPVASLIFVLAAFLPASRYRANFLMIAPLGALSVAYTFYYFQDYSFGPRFLHEAAGGLVILTAAGIYQTPLIARTLMGWSMRRRVILRQALWFIALCFVVGTPLRTRVISASVDPAAADYSAMLQHPGTELKMLTHAIVFVQGMYNWFAALQPFSQEDNIIYAKDLGARNPQLLRHFPGREMYLLKEDRTLEKIEADAPQGLPH